MSNALTRSSDAPLLKGAGEPRSTLVGVIGQHFLDTDTGEYYTCTAVTESRCVWTNSGNIEVGKYSSDSGEIFNDYVHNKSLSINAHSEGGSAVAGGKGFKIISCHNNGDNTGIYSLSSVEGLSSGMAYSVRLATAAYNVGTITGVDVDACSVLVTNYPNIGLESNDVTSPETFTVENYLTIVGRPDLGDTDIGFNAHAEGEETIAQDRASHSEGRKTKVIGQYGHAEGRETVAAYAAHAEGRNTQALGDMSHTEGQNNKSLASCSHSEGKGTQATGNMSHSEGQNTVASGHMSHAEGNSANASGSTAHAEGSGTVASGEAAHAEGYETIAGYRAHAEGYKSEATGGHSHAEGAETKALKSHSHAEGYKSEAQNDCAHAENNATIASGYGSHSEGNNTHASGSYSHAEGTRSVAKGEASHAEGLKTIASSNNSHAQGENTNAGTKGFKIASSFTNDGSGTIKFNLNSSEGLNDNLIGTPCTLRVANEFSNGITISGYDTTASTITLKGVPADATYETDSDDASTHTVENFIVIQGHPELGDTDVGHNAHAGGYNTLAQGRETFAAGRDNKVVGQYGAVTGRENIVGHGAFASGRKNTALGTMSHAEGSETKAIGSCAHAEGKNTESYGTYSHAEGSYTKAHGDFTHSEGYRSTASGEASHAEGGDTTAEGNYSHAEGYSSYAKGTNTHSEGNNTYAEGSASHAEGTDSQSVGQSSHAEGRGTLANGTNSHSEGNSTEARGNHSHAEGVKSRTGNADNTGGYAAHAEGNETEATGSSSHSEGNQTHATASCSHAEGNNTYATGSASHAEGAYTIAASSYQHVQGKYNVVDSEGTYAHIIGNGTGNADDQRKNIHTVDWDGNAWFAGKVTAGANNAELATVDKVNELSAKLSSVYTFKGSVYTVSDLPIDANTGDVYNIIRGHLKQFNINVIEVSYQILNTEYNDEGEMIFQSHEFSSCQLSILNVTEDQFKDLYGVVTSDGKFIAFSSKQYDASTNTASITVSYTEIFSIGHGESDESSINSYLSNIGVSGNWYHEGTSDTHLLECICYSSIAMPGDNMAYTEGNWEKLSGIMDLTGYAQKDLSNVSDEVFKAKVEACGISGSGSYGMFIIPAIEDDLLGHIQIETSYEEVLSAVNLNKDIVIKSDKYVIKPNLVISEGQINIHFVHGKDVYEFVLAAGTSVIGGCSGELSYTGQIEIGSSIILNSSSENSNKRFKITIDDNGTLTATEL